MTSETTAATVAGPDLPGGDFVPGPDATARAFLLVAAVFLAIAAVIGVVVAVQLAVPGFLGGVAALGYGRLRPVATDALLYGWLTIGLLGAALYVTPRLAKTALRQERAAAASLGLLVLGYGAGLVAVLAGANQGREYLELPLWSAAIVVLGLIGVAVAVTRTVAAGSEKELGTGQWYLTAALWWLVLTHVAGNIPGITGVNATIQTSFYRASLTGLFIAAAGIGVVYFLVPASTGRPPLRPTRIGRVAFWSLAFTWAWTGPRSLVYGPGPDWLETIGVVFSLALFVPFVLLGADFVAAMRGHWDRVRSSQPLRFVVAGAVLFAMVPVYNLLLALRSSVAIVGLTQWVAGFDVLMFGGAITLWLFALVYFALGESSSVGEADPVARWHLRLTLTGLGVAVFSMLLAGVQTGFTWAASANNGEIAGVGDGFINSVRPLRGLFAAAAVGFAIYAAAQLLALVRVSTVARSTVAPVQSETAAPEPAEPAPPLVLAALLRGAVALFVVAAVSVWLLPSLEADHTDGSLLADASRIYPSGTLVAQGRAVYVQEGCWYCHTQAVRAIVTDVDLGPVSLPNDYVYETPPVIGSQRIGPDLTHAGSRSPTDSAAWVRDHLVDPRADRSWSIMPSYDHLSASDLNAVSAYIDSLK